MICCYALTLIWLSSLPACEHCTCHLNTSLPADESGVGCFLNACTLQLPEPTWGSSAPLLVLKYSQGSPPRSLGYRIWDEPLQLGRLVLSQSLKGRLRYLHAKPDIQGPARCPAYNLLHASMGSHESRLCAKELCNGKASGSCRSISVVELVTYMCTYRECAVGT